jgi:hypothetical protein
MIIEHLTHQGVIDPALLYEQPFTTVAPGGPEQLFDEEKVARLFTRMRTSTTVWLLKGQDPSFKSMWARGSSWIPAEPASPAFYESVEGAVAQKAARTQALTSSVLKPRSRELWRRSGAESAFRCSTGVAQCGGFGGEAREYW